MLKKILFASSLLVSAAFMTNENNIVEASNVDATPYTYFNDVKTTNSHAANIYTLYRMGVVNGYGDNSYGIAKDVSREHIVAMMYRLLKDDAVVIREAKTFKDVPKTHIYYKEIMWAYQVGMIDGSGEYFNPKSSMTREQMSKILVNGFGFVSDKKYTFKDVSVNNWSYEFVNTLYHNKITQLVNFTYNPKNNVTRGQLASFLVRSLEKEEKYNLGINFVREVPSNEVKPEPEVKPNPEPTPEPEKPIVDNSKQSFNSGYNFNWSPEIGQKTLKLNGINNKNETVGTFIKGDGMSLEGVTIGMSENDLKKSFGSYKVDYIAYKDGNYSLSNMESSIFVFKKNNKIVHVFLDNHNKNNVTGVLAINESVYKEKSYLTQSSTELRNGYEDLMVLLINQSRKENGLSPLTNMNNLYGSIARNHSIDMATKNYFSHTSPDGQSTVGSRFNTEEKPVPKLSFYAENIAYGQETFIHAHEGLMNSEGHRRNILSNEFEYVLTGVAFNSKHLPYYTINFYNTYK